MPGEVACALLRPASEAYRIRLAHLFDPLLAVRTSDVEPLPHLPPLPTPQLRLPRHYHGTMDLDAVRLSRDVRSIAEETLQNLSALPNASVRITLHIDVDAPDGIPEQAVRTLVENSRTLKLPPPQFERE